MTDSTTKPPYIDAGSVMVYMAADSVQAYAVQPYDQEELRWPAPVVTRNKHILSEPTDERAIRLKILEVLERLEKVLKKNEKPKRARTRRPAKLKKGKRKSE